jgi:hypothetical protein
MTKLFVGGFPLEITDEFGNAIELPRRGLDDKDSA